MKDDSDRRIAAKILQYADLKNKRVLEIGCGNGRITSLLADLPKELAAIEPDLKRIREARGTVPGAIFCMGSGENLMFSNECFDLVIFTLSLHHQNSNAALREAARVLKHDGTILIIEPVIEGEVEQVFALVHNENAAKREAQRAIENSSLYIQRSEKFHANWVFESKDELCQSVFAYYEAPFDPRTAERICNLLGLKSDDRPLELQDMMLIQALVKE